MFHDERPDREICDQHGYIFAAELQKESGTAKQLTHRIVASGRLEVSGYLASDGSVCARALAAVCPNRIFLLSSLIADWFVYGRAFA